MEKLLDTTLLIDILRGDERAASLLEKEHESYCTTDINVFELFVGIHAIAQNQSSRKQAAEQLLARLHILPLTNEAAKAAAATQGTLYQKGNPISDADCLIAAIATTNGIYTIVTRNSEHFERITGIAVQTY